MPTFRDPVADGEEARQALRGLAHATRGFDDPSDTYAVIGELLGGVRSLRQVFDQLATAHLQHRDRAHADDGNHLVGVHAALAAAGELHQVEIQLDQASRHSGRIAWRPERAPEQPRRWVSVVFLQGEEADEVLAILDRDGTDAVIEHLSMWDYGDETTDAALINGYVYDTPPLSGLDRLATVDGYALTYNPSLGHIGLLRELTTPPDPALTETVVTTARDVQSAAPRGLATSSPDEAHAAESSDWFRVAPLRAGAWPKGLSL